VTVDRVDADTQNLGVGGAEAVEICFHAGDLGASRGGEVEGVEEQHHVPPTPELIETDFPRKLILEREPGRGLSNFDHHGLLQNSRRTL
jgi:hypothetical protein